MLLCTNSITLSDHTTLMFSTSSLQQTHSQFHHSCLHKSLLKVDIHCIKCITISRLSILEISTGKYTWPDYFKHFLSHDMTIACFWEQRLLKRLSYLILVEWLIMSITWESLIYAHQKKAFASWFFLLWKCWVINCVSYVGWMW